MLTEADMVKAQDYQKRLHINRINVDEVLVCAEWILVIANLLRMETQWMDGTLRFCIML